MDSGCSAKPEHPHFIYCMFSHHDVCDSERRGRIRRRNGDNGCAFRGKYVFKVGRSKHPYNGECWFGDCCGKRRVGRIHYYQQTDNKYCTSADKDDFDYARVFYISQAVGAFVAELFIIQKMWQKYGFPEAHLEYNVYKEGPGFTKEEFAVDRIAFFERCVDEIKDTIRK